MRKIRTFEGRYEWILELDFDDNMQRHSQVIGRKPLRKLSDICIIKL